jgi:hypothetical protein
LIVIISRESTGDDGTQGQLVATGGANEFSCCTLELPWRDNAQGISCIPQGEYDCEFNWSNGLRRMCYLLYGVDRRSGVRIHSGNFAGDKSKGLKTHIQGCILLGSSIGSIAGQLAILNSVTTVREFQDFMNEQPFILKIEGDF